MTTSNSDPYGRNTDNSSGDSDLGTTKQKAKEDMQEVKRELGAMANEKADAVQHKIADGADALSEAIDAAASNLDDHDRQGLARYARKLSSNIASMAGQLEGRSVDELAKDAKQLARNNPALFMLGSIAVGFGLSRFFKASAEHDHDSNTANDNAHRAGSYQNRTDNGSSDRSTQQPAMESYGSSTSLQNGNGRNLP